MPFDFAVPDWEQRLRQGRSPLPALPVNETRARKAVNLFDALRLPDQPGTPRLGDAIGDWFRDILRLALASEDPATLLPIVNQVFVMVPKKNGKTTLSAALGLTALLLWDRPNANLLILGPTQAVSDRCFRQAADMIKIDPRLSKIFEVQEHLKRITRKKTGSTLSVKTFDLNVVTGEIPALTIVDELHVISAKPYADRVLAQIKGGMITNPSALVVYITTQSDTPPRGVFRSTLKYARGVRDGQIAGSNFLPVLYELPEAIQIAPDRPWSDPALWHLVNPSLGRGIDLRLMRDQFTAVVEDGKDAVDIWASQHLNIQMGAGKHDGSWVGADYWSRCADDRLDLDRLIATSDVAVIGVDAGGADDLFGLAVIGRNAKSKVWQGWVRAWATEDVLARRKSIATLLRDFEADGDLVITPDAASHVQEAAAICARVRDAGLLPAEQGIGADPYGIAALLDELTTRRGFRLEDVVGVKQGGYLSGTIKGLERRLMDRRMAHAGQPLMDWCVGNAKVRHVGNNIRIEKSEEGVAKIDPLIALFNAAQLMERSPDAGEKSYLEAAELMVL